MLYVATKCFISYPINGFPYSEERSVLFLPIQFMTASMCAHPGFTDLLSRLATTTVHAAAGSVHGSPLPWQTSIHKHTRKIQSVSPISGVMKKVRQTVLYREWLDKCTDVQLLHDELLLSLFFLYFPYYFPPKPP